MATLEPNPHGNVIKSVTSGSTPLTEVEEYWDGNIPWLTPRDITSRAGIFASTTERFISQEGLEASSAKLLPPGTVLLTKRAPVGAAVVNSVPMATNQGFLNLQCGANLLPVFLCIWLRANKPYLDAVANGSTYPELYARDLFEFEISIPPISEQRKICRYLMSLELAIGIGNALETSTEEITAISGIHDDTASLIRFRDSITPRLLSGEVLVGVLSSRRKSA